MDYFILHTGQHYSYNMDGVFFEQLELPDAKYNLDVGSGSHGEQTAKILIGVEKILRNENPDMVLVEGDTNSVLATALAAVKLGIKIGHIEAGLRSYDKRMPEEINRVLTDHCSDFLFAPTENSRRILLKEGIPTDRIYVTGNSIVDAVFRNMRISEKRKSVLDDFNLRKDDFFLVTIHRQENVDDIGRFKGILKGLKRIREEFDTKVIYPIHPRATKRLKEFGLKTEGLVLIDPLDYLGFLQILSNARLVLTDSGGIQEEAYILRIPCVTLRDNTERPETLEVGSNILSGTSPERILQKTRFMLSKDNNWENPFGDGQTGKRIVEVLRKDIQQEAR